jgi:ankyrin repeat protein
LIAYGVFVFGAFMLVYGVMSMEHNRAYNKSFHQEYSVNDYNDSTIQFYVKELDKPSKAFVHAEGMYEIFESDVKRDLAGNCISYFLRQHKEDNWINLTGNFKKNARNIYANTKERIAKVKDNESYLGRHFYDYDLNDVNEIKDKIVNIWGDESANEKSCRKYLSVNEMYQQFILKYIQNREEALVYYEKEIKPTGTLNQSFYQKEIEKTKDWLQILYVKHPEYLQYKKRQKILQQNKKQNDFWRSVKEGKVYDKGYFEGFNANIIDENGMTALMVATQLGTLEKIERTFMEANFNFYAKDNEGKNVFSQIKERIKNEGTNKLQQTYVSLRVLETKKVLQGKAKIMGYTYDNASDKLSITISKGPCSIFTLPERTSCSVKVRKSKWDPIFNAIYHSDDVELERLLAEGGHENVKNAYGHSALFYAIPKNHYALKRLLESGADMYALGKFGNSTPLLSAVRSNDMESVKILLDHGMDINFKHPRGNSVLDEAVIHCKKKEMIRFLRKNGAKFLITDERKLKRYCKEKDFFNEMKINLN